MSAEGINLKERLSHPKSICCMIKIVNNISICVGFLTLKLLLGRSLKNLSMVIEACLGRQNVLKITYLTLLHLCLIFLDDSRLSAENKKATNNILSNLIFQHLLRVISLCEIQAIFLETITHTLLFIIFTVMFP